MPTIITDKNEALEVVAGGFTSILGHSLASAQPGKAAAEVHRVFKACASQAYEIGWAAAMRKVEAEKK